ncbi:MAG: excinuclease ABC subunit C, partial [Oleiphilaceae bacterium]
MVCWMSIDQSEKTLSTHNNNPVDEFDSKSFLAQLTKAPGVYRMYNAKDEILYVGKAKNLKSRVSSYFLKRGHSVKTQSLVKKITNIEITITSSETEALILEQNLIKELKPPYNILLRDDKSYPYIYLATDKPFPSLSMKRAKTLGKVGRYFGPFPSSGSVRESLSLLE